MAWAEKDQAGTTRRIGHAHFARSAGTTRRSGDGVNADGGGDDDDDGDNGNTSQ